MPTGTLVLPEPKDVRLGIGYGENGTEFIGSLDGPPPPTLEIIDNGNGTGGQATITNSNPDTFTTIYYSNLELGTKLWVMVSVVYASSGTVNISLSPGRYIFSAQSHLTDGPGGFFSSFHTVVVADFTVAGTTYVYDRADGLGINVNVLNTDPAAVNTIQFRDTAISPESWRDSGQRIGNGLYTIPIGEATTQGVFTRSYWVRIQSVHAGVTNYTVPALVTPTKGYKANVFNLMLLIKHAIISLNVARIGGRVFHCIDPRNIQTLPELPAVYIYQGSPEIASPADNRTTFIDVPIRVQIADTLEGDWIGDVEWWLYARQAIFDELHRFMTVKFGKDTQGRRWRVEPGPLILGDPQEYAYRASELVVHADTERNIGG